MTKAAAAKIRAKIKTLRRSAETGEQWAEICGLENKLVAAGFRA